jgi:hypothetical protein
MTSGFQFTARVYGMELVGVGYAFGWDYAPGQQGKLDRLSARQVKRVALRMRRAWELAR